MSTLKITGILLCLIMPVYLVISFIGPAKLGIRESQMVTLRLISWITLAAGNLLLLYIARNNKKELQKRLLYTLLLVLVGLGAIFLA